LGICRRVATHKAQQMEALVHKWVGYAREMNEVRALQEKRAAAIEENTAALQALLKDAQAMKEEADGKVPPVCDELFVFVGVRVRMQVGTVWG